MKQSPTGIPPGEGATVHHLIDNWPWLYAGASLLASAVVIVIGTNKARRDAGRREGTRP